MQHVLHTLMAFGLSLALVPLCRMVATRNGYVARPRAEAWEAAQAPIKQFMLKQTRKSELQSMINASKEAKPGKPEDVSLTTLIRSGLRRHSTRLNQMLEATPASA